MNVYEAARRAREVADASIDRGDHALANALEAARRCEEDRVLANGLVEPGPVDDLPPWSEVSAQRAL